MSKDPRKKLKATESISFAFWITGYMVGYNKTKQNAAQVAFKQQTIQVEKSIVMPLFLQAEQKSSKFAFEYPQGGIMQKSSISTVHKY